MATDDAQALVDRACQAHEGGRLPEAERLYREALAARSDCVEALLGLGVLLRNAGRLDEARSCLMRCAVLAPHPAYAWLELGLVQVATGDREGAAQSFASAARADPALPGAHADLGLVLADLGRFDAALAAFAAALALQPADARLLKSYALVALDAGRPLDALGAAERAAAAGLAPADAAGLAGLAHLCARQYDRAEAAFRRALELAPGAQELAVSLGATLEGAGRVDEAIALYREFLQRHPGQMHAQFMLALLLLGRGEFAEGWRLYAGRPSAREAREKHDLATDSGALAGQRVLVLTEQGIGDEVFFLRYLPWLREQARPEAIAYDPSPKFRGIARRIAALDDLCAEGMAPWWSGPKVLLADLPLLCGARAEAPPPLRIEPLAERLAQWRAALAAYGPGPHLAVTWRGGRVELRPGQVQWFTRLQLKRVDPAALGAALRGWPGTVVCVQHEPEAGELDAFRGALGRPVFDASRANDDLEDLLALLAAVDECVGVSTTGAHLRGAAGGAARILVQHPPEWRWMHRGDAATWYPGFRLYRQDAGLDWTGALKALRADLGL